MTRGALATAALLLIAPICLFGDEPPRQPKAVFEAVVSQQFTSSEWHSVSVQIQDLPQLVSVKLGDDQIVKFTITPIMQCMALVQMEADSWTSRTPDAWPVEVSPGSILKVDNLFGHHLFEVKVEFVGYDVCHRAASDT